MRGASLFSILYLTTIFPYFIVENSTLRWGRFHFFFSNCPEGTRHFHVMALKIEVRQEDTDQNFELRRPKTWAGFTLISELTMHGVLIQYIILIWFNVVYEQLILDQDYDWVLCLWKAVAGVWIACVGMIVPYWKRSDIINIVQTLTTLNLQQREGFCQYELLLSDDADC